MRSPGRRLRWLAVVFAIGLLVTVVGIGTRVWTVTRPVRAASPTLEFDSVRIAVEEVQLAATDGVALTGWLFSGGPGPPVVLAHDLDGSRADLLPLALALRARGFTALALDLRAHGDSAGSRSTLGLAERRDVAGAIDFLRDRGLARGSLGVFGRGIGAHAAALAAASEPRITVLVLDRLYPDASWPLVRRVWTGEARPIGLDRVSRAAFAALGGGDILKNRASDALASLGPRDILLIAPASDPELIAAERAMLATIPEDPDHDGNLLIDAESPAGSGDGTLSREYAERVVSFFESRLIRAAVATKTRASVKP